VRHRCRRRRADDLRGAKLLEVELEGLLACQALAILAQGACKRELGLRCPGRAWVSARPVGAGEEGDRAHGNRDAEDEMTYLERNRAPHICLLSAAAQRSQPSSVMPLCACPWTRAAQP